MIWTLFLPMYACMQGELAYADSLYTPSVRSHNIKVSRLHLFLWCVWSKLFLLVECQQLDFLTIVQDNLILLYIQKKKKKKDARKKGTKCEATEWPRRG